MYTTAHARITQSPALITRPSDYRAIVNYNKIIVRRINNTIIRFCSQLNQLLAQPEASIADIEIPPAALEDENGESADSPLPSGVSDSPMSQEEENESSDKNYEDEMSVERYASNSDEDKVYDCAGDRRAETSSSQQYEQATRNESCEETVKSEHAPSRDNPGKSRCKWNCSRKRTHWRTPNGIVIDVDTDIAGTKRSGFKISVISVHNLAPDARFVAIRSGNTAGEREFADEPESDLANATNDANEHSLSLFFRLRSARIPKHARKAIANSLLTLFCDGNRDRTRKIGRLVKHDYRNHRKTDKRIESANKISGSDAIYMTDRSVDALSEQQELPRTVDNPRPFYASDEILDSMKCCHHDAALLEANNAQYSISCAGQAYAAHGELCCSIFNDEHPMYHVCEQEDYNTDTSDFNPEAETDWTPVRCIHAAYTEACRCSCDSCGYYSGINMQFDHSPIGAELLKHFASSHWLQREEIGQFGLAEAKVTSVAAEFATGIDEYSRDGVGDRRRAVRRKLPKVAFETGNPGDFRGRILASPRKFDRHTTSLPERKRLLRKTDSSRGRQFADTRAKTIGDCIEQCRESSERSPRLKRRFVPEMDAKWMRNPIGTDDQQLDYKWKRRIAPIDDGMRVNVDFKGKRDSR